MRPKVGRGGAKKNIFLNLFPNAFKCVLIINPSKNTVGSAPVFKLIQGT